MRAEENTNLKKAIEKEIGNYEEAENFLYELPRFTEKNTLSHTKELLKRMGNPCVDIPKIHVAGTNGKGSVCAYLQNLLQEYGYRTGAFISPHLVSMHERFLINGQPVEDAGFMESFCRVKQVADKAFREGVSYPTFFEFLFLMGMDIFAKQEISVLVLETGLGGRLDATNVFDAVDVCVITAIGLDHCQYLGNTREAIAGEKAGIIKKDSSVIFLNRKDTVSSLLMQKTQEKGAHPFPVEQEAYFVEKIKHKNIDFSYQSRYYNYISLSVSTDALYQVENAVLALHAFEAYLEKREMTPMSVTLVQRAVANTVWEGRMEEVLPDVYFDGAHNENGMEAFLETVKAMEIKGRRILCFSAVEDKAYGRMISMLADSKLFDAVAVVEMETERGVSLEKLETYFSQYDQWEIRYIKGAEEGLQQCLQWKSEEDTVYIVGSLYLIGLIKAVLRRRNHD
jgi:dihydrofolate synthase/folylpolyglutamate synthase